MIERNPSYPGSNKYLKSHVDGREKAALVTPCLSHLPFQPSCSLGYGAAVLTQRYDVDVIDLNAELYFMHMEKLNLILDVLDKNQVISDTIHLDPFYDEFESHIDGHYAAIPWEKYSLVYVTPPSWCPTLPTEAVLRLYRAIRRVSPNTKAFFFGNTLGTWTDAGELKSNGIQIAHLNDLFAVDPTARPVNYDVLPTPIYENRDKYLFDTIPFMLNHGCSWGRCRFCSIARGWNSGHVERTAGAAIKELEELIDRYDPATLICTNDSINGHRLIEFCRYFERFGKPWCGMSRADLSGKKMEALRRAGCRLIYFGLESGSDRVLQVLNKGISTRQMSDFIKGLHSNGILPVPSIIVGSPGEEAEDFAKTIDFLAEHRRYLEAINVYSFVSTPASEFGSQKRQPDRDTPLRLFQLLHTCEDLGLKACEGDECVQYVLLKKVSSGQPDASSGQPDAS